MPVIDIILHEPAWPELAKRPAGDVLLLKGPIGITALAGGMASGRASVAIRIDLPDGRVVIQETSLLALVTAVRGLVARFGDPTDDAGATAPLAAEDVWALAQEELRRQWDSEHLGELL